MDIQENASEETSQARRRNSQKPQVPTCNRAPRSARAQWASGQEAHIRAETRKDMGIDKDLDANLIQRMFPDRTIKA